MCQKPNCSAPELCLEQLKFTRLHLDKQISSTGCILTHIELILLLWTNLLPVSFVVLPYNLIIYDDLIILSTFTFSSSFFLKSLSYFQVAKQARAGLTNGYLTEVSGGLKEDESQGVISKGTPAIFPSNLTWCV